jgi:hypothetical protein
VELFAKVLNSAAFVLLLQYSLKDDWKHHASVRYGPVHSAEELRTASTRSADGEELHTVSDQHRIYSKAK